MALVGARRALIGGAASLEKLILAEPSLMGYWPLDDAAGSSAFVDKKAGRNATISNGGTGVVLEQSPLYAGGPKAAQFVAASSGRGILSAGDSAAFNFERTDAFSIEFIIKPNITRSGSQVFYSVVGKLASASPYQGWEIAAAWKTLNLDRTTFYIQLTNSWSGNALGLTSRSDLDNATVYHCLLTYDGTSLPAGVRLYIDGGLDGLRTTFSSLSATIKQSNQLTIGSRQAVNYQKSTMGQVAIYNSKLAQSKALAHARKVKATPAEISTFPASPVIVLDTDLCGDVGDLGAMGTLMALAAAGRCTVGAVTICASNDFSAPVARICLDRAGLTSVPVGAYQGSTLPGTSAWTQSVRNRFATDPDDTRANYDDAVTVLRQALADAADGSVVLVGIGTMTNLNELLASSADGISALDGSDLIAAKVNRVVVAAGQYGFSDIAEYNFAHDAAAANAFFAGCPVDIVCVGIEQGDYVGVHPPAAADPLTNPYRYGYDLYGLTGSQTRPAWDELGVLYGVLGLSDNFMVRRSRGTNTVNSSTGVNTWTATAGNASYLARIKGDTEMGDYLNSLLAVV